MRFIAYSQALAEVDLLSVDGVAPTGPNLSHWPGNRTPERYRADTSTESVLAAVRDAPGWRRLWRELVTNTHYDTDGLLSVAVALRPELAAQARPLIEAAWVGDLFRFPSREAFVLDRCLAGLNEHPASPLAEELKHLGPVDRLQRVFDHALARLDDLRRDPAPLEPLWREELEQLERDWLRLNQASIEVRRAADLALVVSRERLHRNALHQACPQARLLECWGQGEVCLSYAIDSWFRGVTLSRAPRHPLERLAERWAEADPNLELGSVGRVDALWPELRARTRLSPARLLELTFAALREMDAGHPSPDPSPKGRGERQPGQEMGKNP